MDSYNYPDPVLRLDEVTGYVWAIVGPHPSGEGWLAVRWMSPGLGYSVHAVTIPESRLEAWPRVEAAGV